MKISFFNDYIRESSRNAIRVREDESLNTPGILPKIPGCFYYLFGKPIETRGRYESLKDRENANKLYSQVKSGVESCIAYLLKKQEEDPYRRIFDRTVHRALHSPLHEIPTFEL
ncbi:phytyl ester synthase 1, chloroplastic-like [Syzygium oleosum]|uniref:phytyl ester synthase 1, chloroplastic-like n=1 Tax=Syzygium oleosum TaxID=219896 RepID=UPI0024B9EBDD|nr:phytyl ester synthase 1, chloroplastic-like [Syzygium oleosum]